MRSYKLMIFLVLIIGILSIGAVSASDLNNAYTSDNGSQLLDNSNTVDINSSNNVGADSQVLSSTENYRNSTVSPSNNTPIKTSNTIQVSSSNYDTYFNDSGFVKSGISSGDTVDLTGTFNNKNFIFDIPVTVTSSSNAKLNNCTVKITKGGDGSTISNLQFENYLSHGIGVFVSNVSDVVINNINFYGDGNGAYGIFLNNTNNSKVISNRVTTKSASSDQKWTRPAIVLSNSFYNIIDKNYVEVEDSNGIYLSKYNGGVSDYNNITNNVVNYTYASVTSWSYGINLMGSYNIAENNTVIGAYRGIVTQTGAGNQIINNTLINLNGVDYSTGSITGGDCAIELTPNSIAIGNKIINSSVANGIHISGDNVNVINNTIDCTLDNSVGVSVEGSNASVVGNLITARSNGIFVVGPISNILINNNTVNTDSIGILVKKQSRVKYPVNVVISNNTINTSGDVAINAQEAGGLSNVTDDNIVNGKTVVYPGMEPSTGYDDNTYKYNGTVIHITPDNVDSYFDKNGIMNTSIEDGDVLIFEGNFNGKYFEISSSVKVLGENATFGNSSFRVKSDYVTLIGLNILNNDLNKINQWPVHVLEADYVFIYNCTLNITDNKTAYGIYLQDTKNDRLEGNIIEASGTLLTYGIVGYEVYNTAIKGSEDNTNYIMVYGTGEVHGYESGLCIDGAHLFNEIYRTYGILLLHSSNNTIANNLVNVTSKLNQESNGTNSIVGIDLYFDCFNNTVSNNEIYLEGKDPYMYGTGVLAAKTGSGTTGASGNNFTLNTININGPYFTTGIIIGYKSNNTYVGQNRINLNSGMYTYGVTLEASNNSTLESNTIDGNGKRNYLVELFSSNGNTIATNTIEGNGDYTYGIAAYSGNNNVISGNVINAYGIPNSPVNSTGDHGDSIPLGIAGIYFIGNSENNFIENNTIATNGTYAVNMSSVNNYVVSNNLTALSRHGNNAVNYKNDNVFDNGYLTYNMDIVSGTTIKQGDKLIVSLKDSDGFALEGKEILFVISGKTYSRTTNENGTASITINLNPKTYPITVSFTGDSVSSMISKDVSLVVKSKSKTATVITPTVSNTVKKGSAYSFKLTDKNGNLLKNQKVKITIAGKSYTRTTNSKGMASININLRQGKYVTSIIYAGNSNYNSVTKKFNLVVRTSSVNTKIYVKSSTVKKGTDFVVTLKDQYGSLLVGQKVYIKICGKTYTKVTGSNGVAKIRINLNPKKYTIYTSYKGSGIFKKASTVRTNLLVKR